MGKIWLWIETLAVYIRYHIEWQIIKRVVPWGYSRIEHWVEQGALSEDATDLLK